MILKIKKLIPGHGQNFPVGEQVRAKPHHTQKDRFDIETIHRPVRLRVACVDGEYLEGWK